VGEEEGRRKKVEGIRRKKEEGSPLHLSIDRSFSPRNTTHAHESPRCARRAGAGGGGGARGGRACVVQLVARDVNHACVVAWCVANEPLSRAPRYKPSYTDRERHHVELATRATRERRGRVAAGGPPRSALSRARDHSERGASDTSAAADAYFRAIARITRAAERALLPRRPGAAADGGAATATAAAVRPLMFVSCHLPSDDAARHCDLLGMNAYPGQ